MVLRIGAVGIYCLAVVAGLMAFGAAPRDACYRLFLVMAVACALAAWVYPVENLLRKRFLPLLAIGIFILVQIPLKPPVERYGYVFLALGWLALTFTLLARGRFLFLFLVGLGLLDAFYGLAQAFGGLDTMASGTYANRNHFAGLLNMTIPVAIGGLYATFPRRGQKLRSEGYAWAWIILLVTAFMGLAILLSWSRGGALSLVASLIFLSFLLMMKRRGGENRRRLSGGAAWVLLLTTVGLGAWVGIDTLIERFGKAEDDSTERLLVYRDSVRMIAAYPLGVGPKMYQYYFKPPVDISQDCRWTHAHNDYLETAVEWGVVLAVLFWGFVGWRLWRAGRNFLDGSIGPGSSAEPGHRTLESPATIRDSVLWREGIALGCAGAIFSILLHSLVDFNLQIPVNWVVFCMVLGLTINATSEGLTGRGPRLLMAGGLSVFLLFPGWTVFKEAVSIQIADSETIAGFEEALDWVPDQPVYHFPLGLLYRDDVERQDLQKAGEHLEAAIRLNPREWSYWQELGRYYEFTGATDKAEKAMLTCLEIMPLYASERWRLGNFYLREGRVAEALPQIRRAIELNPTYRDPALMVLWKAGLMGRELDQVWPGDKDSQLIRARFLVGRGAPDSEIRQQWRRVVQSAGKGGIRSQEASFYLTYLNRSRAMDELCRLWIEINRAEGAADPDFEKGRTLVWNGQFRLPVNSGLLNWQLPKSEAYETSVDDEAFKIKFGGTHNVSFGMRQQVIVPGAGEYRLTVRARAEEITTEQGPYFRVVDATTGKVLGQMEQLRGSSPWSEQELSFEVPVGSRAVFLELRRNPSKRIDNKIRGVISIGRVELTRAIRGSAQH